LGAVAVNKITTTS